MSTQSNTKELIDPNFTSRWLEIDTVRAIAVILMVITHTGIYFYDYSAQWLVSLIDLGGFVCFSLFLFSSGTTITIGNHRHGSSHTRAILLRRVIIFLLLYLITAISFTLLNNSTLTGNDFFKIVTLQQMPIFADFILGLGLFFAIGAELTRINSRLRANIALLVTSLILIFGWLLSSSSVQLGELEPFTALIWGDPQLHRFPIMQYLFVYVSGIWYAQHKRYLSILSNSMIALLLTIVSSLSIFLWGFDRWLATPGFILFGLTFAAYIILAVKISSSLRASGFLTTVESCLTSMINIVSSSSAGVLIWHLIVILILKLSGLPAIDTIPVLILILAVTALSVAVGKNIKL